MGHDDEHGIGDRDDVGRAPIFLGGAMVFAVLGFGGYMLWSMTIGNMPTMGATPSVTKPVDTPAGSPVAQWDGSTQLVCGDNDVLTVNGVTAKLVGQSAIVASGNCQLTLVDCSVTAGTGIEATGNAKVRMEGGTLAGAEAAIDASGNAQVALAGVSVKGGRRSSAPAKISEKAAR